MAKNGGWLLLAGTRRHCRNNGAHHFCTFRAARIVPAPNSILAGGRSHRDTRSPQWRGRRTHPQFECAARSKVRFSWSNLVARNPKMPATSIASLRGRSRPTCRSSRRLGTSWLSICANEPRASVSRLYRLISQQSEKLLYIGGDNGHQRVDLAEKMVVLVAVKYARSLNGKIERELLRRFAGTHLCYST
jgi:hypothetical protein